VPLSDVSFADEAGRGNGRSRNGRGVAVAEIDPIAVPRKRAAARR
jgi:hypothetical protein